MANDTPSKIRPRRPWRVTVFSLAVLFFGSGLNLLRGAWAWGQADALAGLHTSLPMPLLAGASLVWSVVFAVCAVGLWRLRPWGRQLMLIAVTLYHGYIWLNHIAFDQADYARQVRPFAVVHTLVMLLLVWGFLMWPSIRQLYQTEESKHEPGPENSTPA